MRLLANSPIWPQFARTQPLTAQSSAFFRSNLRACTLNGLRSLVLVLCVATSLVAIAQDERKCPPRETYKSLRYDEDWSRLGWVMLRGAAEILAAGAEHEPARLRSDRA